MSEKISSVSRMSGQYLYEKHCLSCHGKTGLGDGPEAKRQKVKPSNLQQLAKEVEHFRFFMAVSELEGKMPGWKNPFTEEENENLANYIKSFK